MQPSCAGRAPPNQRRRAAPGRDGATPQDPQMGPRAGADPGSPIANTGAPRGSHSSVPALGPQGAYPRGSVPAGPTGTTTGSDPKGRRRMTPPGKVCMTPRSDASVQSVAEAAPATTSR